MRRRGPSRERPWETPLPNVPVRVLLNPASGNGLAERRWARIESLARTAFPGLIVERPNSALGLSEAASRAARKPGLILAAGGDGTSHLVINGLLENDSPPISQLGWLPLGSGNDIARVNGVPLDPPRAVHHYRNLAPGTVDVGLVRYRDERSQPRHRYFGNSFTLGITAHVLRIVERFGKPLGGRLSYFGAALLGLSTHRPFAAKLNGQPMDLRLVSVTNGSSFGAGMRIAPMALIDDGELDLVTLGATSRTATGLLFPRIYTGGHLAHPAVGHQRVRRLLLETEGPAAFEIDGELTMGEPPFEVEIVPGGLAVAKAPPGRPVR